MDFKKATDELLVTVTLDDLAKALGVSVQSVRQARMSEGNLAHRSPPPQWERATIAVINRRIQELLRLNKSLKTQMDSK